MTNQPAPIDYASPRAADSATAGRGYMGVAAALAAAIGFLGANAFADAAGFPRPRNPNDDAGYVALRVLCGIVVFIISFVVLAHLFRELRALVGALSRSPDRPAAPIALASLVCGTACVIGALGVRLYALRHPAVNLGPGPQVIVGTPLMAHIVTIMAFVVGVALSAIAIWSSMGRTSAAVSIPLPQPS